MGDKDQDRKPLKGLFEMCIADLQRHLAEKGEPPISDNQIQALQWAFFQGALMLYGMIAEADRRGPLVLGAVMALLALELAEHGGDKLVDAIRQAAAKREAEARGNGQVH